MKSHASGAAAGRAASLRYLHVISSLDPEGGGPAEGVRQLSYAARQAGHGMEIATLDAADVAHHDGIDCPVHNLGPGFLGSYRYNPALTRWLRANAARFDAVIVNGLWQYHGFAVWQCLRNSVVPYFVFAHGMLDPWFRQRYPLKHLKKWLYWPWAEYRILRDARAVLFTCEEERRLARNSFGFYTANEVVVSYGTPGPAGDAALQVEQFYRRFPLLRGRKLLLFLGRIHPKKGCELLVEAFRIVAPAQPDWHLVFAGPDSNGLRDSLLANVGDAALRERITFAGMLSGDLKWGALRAASAFVLPSHQENFGIAVAEALSCGLPVLISDKVNIWREVQQDGAGLVAADTREGTVHLLRRWAAASGIERADMSRNAVRCFNGRFKIETASASLIDVMRRNLLTRGHVSSESAT